MTRLALSCGTRDAEPLTDAVRPPGGRHFKATREAGLDACWMLTENPGAIAKHTARLPRGVMRRFGDDVGRLVAGVAALPWSVVGWRGTARSGRGARRCEVELDAGGGDALLLAGQQGQRAGI